MAGKYILFETSEEGKILLEFFSSKLDGFWHVFR